MKVRTRFAPSPTGMMHVGNLRSAIFEYLVAKNNNGDFILRIEDTDQSRKVEGAVEFIYDTITKCGLIPDEGPINGGNYGPYFQSERLYSYKNYAEKLVEMGKAYYCFCDEERLDKLRKEAEDRKVAFMYDGYCKNLTKEQIKEKLDNNEPYVIRQAMPKEGTSSYIDLVYGEIKVENRYLEDQILLKSDGFPTYNFANVIDDHLMEITHVIRGNEYLSSTPKYNLLYDAFGWERPTYVHLPLVLDFDGKKLSKRNNAASFMDLYKEGYLPEAIVNYLALLGWSSEDGKEIFSLEELTKNFSPKRINKAPAIYDVKKLNWVNSHYMKKLSEEEFCNLTIPHVRKKYNVEGKDEWLRELVLLFKNSLSYGSDILNNVEMFFSDELNPSEECLEFLKQEEVPKIINTFKDEINNIEVWSVESISKAIENTKNITNTNGKLLYMPLRIKISGIMHGPELANTIHLIGKEETLKRLQK